MKVPKPAMPVLSRHLLPAKHHVMILEIHQSLIKTFDFLPHHEYLPRLAITHPNSLLIKFQNDVVISAKSMHRQ